MFGVDIVFTTAMSQTTAMLFSSCHFYLIVFLNCGTIFLIDLGFSFIKSTEFGDATDYFRKVIKANQHTNEHSFTRLLKPTIQLNGLEVKTLDLPGNSKIMLEKAPTLKFTAEKADFTYMESKELLLRAPAFEDYLHHKTTPTPQREDGKLEIETLVEEANISIEKKKRNRIHSDASLQILGTSRSNR